MTPDSPMPPDRLAKLVARRGAVPRLDPLVSVPVREPATDTSDLAAEILGEAAGRPLESGELLLVSEEATLDDLEAAVVGIASASELPAISVDDPVLATLTPPRLLSHRIWEALLWQPPLAEHVRLLEASLLVGNVVPQVMLVGHMETFPERVEHLTRLRHLVETAGAAGGGVVVKVRLAEPDDLPPATPQLARILAGARPGDPDIDRRHALALARLTLGPGSVLVPD